MDIGAKIGVGCYASDYSKLLSNTELNTNFAHSQEWDIKMEHLLSKHFYTSITTTAYPLLLRL